MIGIFSCHEDSDILKGRMCQQKKESVSTEKDNPLPDSGEVFAEGEGLFVSLGLDSVGFAHLESGAADVLLTILGLA